METYASQSLNTINTWFSGANKNFFPPRCNPLGFTDVDAYCATSTGVACCGLCVNTSVAGLGQFSWACLTYALTAIGWNLAPDAVWGLGIMQILSANAFIGSGWLRVKLGADQGGMTRWHTKFLFPQALGCIAIMGASVFAPQWMRLGESEVSVEEAVRREKGSSATRSDVRAREKAILKQSHRCWSYSVLLFWFINLTIWTVLYFWFTYGSITFSQSNCESEIHPSVSPDSATIALGVVAWLLFFGDCFVVWKETGMSDWLIDHVVRQPDLLASKHRQLERKLTMGVTAFLYALWFSVNVTLYVDGLDSFLLSGADIWSFGQIEQMTALFVDMFGLVLAVGSYLSSRDELERARLDYEKTNLRIDLPPQLDVEIDRKPLWPEINRRRSLANSKNATSVRSRDAPDGRLGVAHENSASSREPKRQSRIL
ncbi:hypothetical protein JCM3766R1_006200 [Sporobolomyces carnicolor]